MRWRITSSEPHTQIASTSRSLDWPLALDVIFGEAVTQEVVRVVRQTCIGRHELVRDRSCLVRIGLEDYGLLGNEHRSRTEDLSGHLVRVAGAVLEVHSFIAGSGVWAGFSALGETRTPNPLLARETL